MGRAHRIPACKPVAAEIHRERQRAAADARDNCRRSARGNGARRLVVALSEFVARLFGMLREHKIDNVVFLAGDIHCSLFARIEIGCARRAEPLRAWSIVSSGLNAPYRFANDFPNQYVRCSRTAPTFPDWVRQVLGDVSWTVMDESATDGHGVGPCHPVPRPAGGRRRIYFVAGE